MKTSIFSEACKAWDDGRLADAFRLFSSAAAEGDASCQLNLGYFYDNGIHVSRDVRLAVHWYHQAYRQGEAAGASNIATIHRDHKAYSRMIWWWRAAIRMGDNDAWLELGRCYEAGRGVSKNLDRAAFCYSQLLAAGHTTEVSREMASKRLRRIGKR